MTRSLLICLSALLLLGCPRKDPEPVGPPPSLKCLEDSDTWGDDAVLVEPNAALEVLAQHVGGPKGKGASPDVSPGNCDLAFPAAVMRKAEIFRALPEAARETALKALVERGGIEPAESMGSSATGYMPSPDTLARRSALTTLLNVGASGKTGAGVGVIVVDGGAPKPHPALKGALAAEEWCAGDASCTGGTNSCFGPGCAACEHTSECYHGSGSLSLVAGRRPDGSMDPNDPAEEAGLWIAPGATALPARLLWQGVHQGVGSATPQGETTRAAALIKRIITKTSVKDYPIVYLGFAANSDASARMCGRRKGGLFGAMVTRLAQERLVVAPSGNEGVASIAAPACFDGVISVGAWGRDDAAAGRPDKTDAAAGWSNGGGSVKILGPGEDVPVAIRVDPSDSAAPAVASDYANASGTSIAGAAVAGALAVAVEAKGFTAVFGSASSSHTQCIAIPVVGSADRLDMGAIGGANCP